MWQREPDEIFDLREGQHETIGITIAQILVEQLVLADADAAFLNGSPGRRDALRDAALLPHIHRRLTVRSMRAAARCGRPWPATRGRAAFRSRRSSRPRYRRSRSTASSSASNLNISSPAARW